MKKKPIGRPKKADDEKRERYLQVRISDSEKLAFEEAATGAGLEVSQWVRMTLLSAIKAAGK